MLLKCITRITGIAGLALLLQGASGAGAADQAGIEPRAAEILKAALTHLAGNPSFKIRSDVISETVLPSGQRLHYPGRLELAVRRPDRLWYKLDGAQRSIAAWYDGSTFTLLDSDRNTCASTPAPKGLGQLFDDMATRLGFRPPLSVLLRDDSPKVVLERMVSGFYVGREELEGKGYHHLAFQQANVDLEFWVAADGDPLLKKVVIIQKKLPTLPQLSYTIVAWEPAATLDEALFRFEPPANVIRCDFQSLTK